MNINDDVEVLILTRSLRVTSSDLRVTSSSRARWFFSSMILILSLRCSCSRSLASDCSLSTVDDRRLLCSSFSFSRCRAYIPHTTSHTHTHTHTRPRVTHDISVSSCLFSKLAINNLTTLCHKQLDSKLYRKFFRLDHQINNTNKDIVFVYHRAQTRQAWRSLVEMAMSIRQATW